MPTIHYPPPAFSLADAARIAQSHFGIDGVVTLRSGARQVVVL